MSEGDAGLAEVQGAGARASAGTEAVDPPAGWVAVVDSRELPPGAVVGYFPEVGEPLVVWRSAGGHLAALEDRCPHQWSSLSAVGVVDGEEIVCTTHFWRFGVDGAGCKQSMHGRRDDKDSAVIVECRDDGSRVWVRTSA